MTTRNAERVSFYQRALITPGGRPDQAAADLGLTTGERRIGADRAYASLIAEKRHLTAVKVADEHQLGDFKVMSAVRLAFEDELVSGRLDDAKKLGDRYMLPYAERPIIALVAIEACADGKITDLIRTEYKLQATNLSIRT